MDEQEALVINQIVGDLLKAVKDVLAPVRQIYQAVDPFDTMTDQQFIGLFRMNKAVAREIIDMRNPFIQQEQTYCNSLKVCYNNIEKFL